MVDWNNIVGRARSTYDKDEVKQELPLEWVMARYGIALWPSGDGRLVGPCPFHADDNPSFALFGDSLERCGCWSCDFTGGDVFDFIGRVQGLDFREALRVAGELLEQFRQDTAWVAQAGTGPRPKADPAELAQVVAQALALADADNTAIKRCIDEKGWKFSAQWLREQWFVGVEDDFTIVVPHYGANEEGQWEVRGLKTRTPRSHLYARGGSDLQELYGVWRDRGRPRVLICEGESDAWTAAWALEQAGIDDFDVFALPHGANTPPKPQWVTLMAGRHVTLALDGDAAGRTAMRAFHRALDGHCSSVLIVGLPDGKDLASVDNPIKAILEATGVPRYNGAVAAVGSEYQRMGQQGPTELSNWSLTPTRELVLDNGATAYEGIILPHMREVVLRSTDLQSEKTLHSWAEKHGGAFTGTTKDARVLLELLQAEGPFIGRGRATSVIGWHDANLVWPGGRIGPDYWVWMPGGDGAGDVEQASQKLRLVGPGDFDRSTLPLMLQLHRPGVVTPIIAWLGVALLRPEFDRFPPLAVTGTSGSGKTTLVDAMLTAFGWKLETTLTSTTAWGVSALAGGTNAIPLWFDEYRAGAREEALIRFEQALRDAWGGQVSYKGGMGADPNKINAIQTLAPIIVTGEDAFSETSHVERMIAINLPRDGRSEQALRQLRDTNTDGFGHAFAEWLVWSFRAGALPSLAIDLTSGRIDGNIKTLAIGWAIMEQFALEVCGFEMPAPDWSLMMDCLARAAATDPIADALAWAVHASGRDGSPLVMQDGDDAVLRVADFVAEVKRLGQHKLPGNKDAIAAYLRDKWNAVDSRHPMLGRVTRLPGAWSTLA